MYCVPVPNHKKLKARQGSSAHTVIIIAFFLGVRPFPWVAWLPWSASSCFSGPWLFSHASWQSKDFRMGAWLACMLAAGIHCGRKNYTYDCIPLCITERWDWLTQFIHVRNLSSYYYLLERYFACCIDTLWVTPLSPNHVRSCHVQSQRPVYGFPQGQAPMAMAQPAAYAVPVKEV